MTSLIISSSVSKLEYLESLSKASSTVALFTIKCPIGGLKGSNESPGWTTPVTRLFSGSFLLILSKFFIPKFITWVCLFFTVTSERNPPPTPSPHVTASAPPVKRSLTILDIACFPAPSDPTPLAPNRKEQEKVKLFSPGVALFPLKIKGLPALVP